MLVTLIVFGASMTSTVVHFIAKVFVLFDYVIYDSYVPSKTDLINSCSAEENGQPAVTFVRL